jgi:photosystem II stability/assembly factor-like uncharacterized protein
MVVTRTLALLLALVAALAVAACGAGEPVRPGGGADEPRAVRLPGAVAHATILGLDLDPADRSLYLQTSLGLVRVPPRGATAELIEGTFTGPQGSARVRPDSSVAFIGPGRLLGSGHPVSARAAAENLGLMESGDGGRTWQPAALYGIADLHVLRPRGERLYAYDLARNLLLVTRDRGASFDAHEPPAPIADLAADPGRDSRLVAVTASGTMRSEDSGEHFRPLGVRDVEHVAWPASGALYMIDGKGAVRLSTDGGGTSKVVGLVHGRAKALVADGPRSLWIVTEDWQVLRATDGGRRWSTAVELRTG